MPLTVVPTRAAPGCPGQQGLIWSGRSTVPKACHSLRSVEPESPQRNRAALSPLLPQHSPHNLATRFLEQYAVKALTVVLLKVSVMFLKFSAQMESTDDLVSRLSSGPPQTSPEPTAISVTAFPRDRDVKLTDDLSILSA
ncbi:hypothetical protein E5288_WYG000147 [Bos mutus]|uniref:Uncharacterized protein n=1 Tax=Bos mutus TaxID=72004 RepID=A0A6B0RBX0_9CETA|nr:hypothetical protein [Bos mutus]